MRGQSLPGRAPDTAGKDVLAKWATPADMAQSYLRDPTQTLLNTPPQ